jgi:hypothetical protein
LTVTVVDLVELRLTVPKPSGLGVRVNDDPAPLAVSDTVVLPPVALCGMTRLPVCPPSAVGAYWTEMVQLAPGATVAQVFAVTE